MSIQTIPPTVVGVGSSPQLQFKGQRFSKQNIPISSTNYRCHAEGQISTNGRIQSNSVKQNSSTLSVGAEKQNPGSSSGSINEEDKSWLPGYMQPAQSVYDFGDIIDEAEAKATSETEGVNLSASERKARDVWIQIRQEAAEDAAEEPILSSFLYASIMAHQSFDQALAFVLANRMASQTMLATQLFEVFYQIISTCANVRNGAISDLRAFKERDPASRSYSNVLLHFKGFQAVQVHRIANQLWQQDRRVMALALQSQSSEVYSVDIHPAARIGFGVMLDHATGVVIGETATVGNNVSIMQGVTLGGTGKEVGDRHPKINDNVLIGAQATVLGNIQIGCCAQIAAGSLVLKPVESHTLVAGSPAKQISRMDHYDPARSMNHCAMLLKPTELAGGGALDAYQAAIKVNQAEPGAEAPAASSSDNGKVVGNAVDDGSDSDSEVEWTMSDQEASQLFVDDEKKGPEYLI